MKYIILSYDEYTALKSRANANKSETIYELEDDPVSQGDVDILHQRGMMSTKLHGFLWDYGITWLHELSDFTAEEFTKKKGFGVRTYMELVKLMDTYNVRFKKRDNE